MSLGRSWVTLRGGSVMGVISDALARHIGLIATSAVAVLLGTVGGTIVLGLYGVMRRVERLEAVVDGAIRTR